MQLSYEWIKQLAIFRVTLKGVLMNAFISPFLSSAVERGWNEDSSGHQSLAQGQTVQDCGRTEDQHP